MSRGSSFDSFLKEEGIYEEVVRQAAKKVFAEKIRQGMKVRRVSTSELARRMGTSRPSVQRMLDEKRDVTLGTLTRATEALGYDLKVDLIKRALT
jgi:transcriptional regulator with XRE-family HTH domain